MQQVATFDATLGATNRRFHDFGHRLIAVAISAWNGMSQLLPGTDISITDEKPQSLPGYYGSAYDAANAGVPVATFRGLV